MGNQLDDCKNLVIRRWGEMGGYWGINRTMAEIHALLFVSGKPLCTDDVMEQLHVSRGNASMNLRGLVDWGLTRRVHKLGDRKEYFEADGDVWRLFETIMRERRRREVEPIIETIERCRTQIPAPGTGPEGPTADEIREFTRRLSDLQRFLIAMSALFEFVVQLGSEGMDPLLELAAGVATQSPPASAQRARAKKPTLRTRKRT